MVNPVVTKIYRRRGERSVFKILLKNLMLTLRAAKNAAVKKREQLAPVKNITQLALIRARNNSPRAVSCMVLECP